MLIITHSSNSLLITPWLNFSPYLLSRGFIYLPIKEGLINPLNKNESLLWRGGGRFFRMIILSVEQRMTCDLSEGTGQIHSPLALHAKCSLGLNTLLDFSSRTSEKPPGGGFSDRQLSRQHSKLMYILNWPKKKKKNWNFLWFLTKIKRNPIC